MDGVSLRCYFSGIPWHPGDTHESHVGGEIKKTVLNGVR